MYIYIYIYMYIWHYFTLCYIILIDIISYYGCIATSLLLSALALRQEGLLETQHGLAVPLLRGTLGANKDGCL